MKYLTLLGSTGSIGCNTLDIVRQYPNKYVVKALVAGKNVQRMIEQCLEFSPCYAVMKNKESAQQVRDILSESNSRTEVLYGKNAACEMARLSDINCVISAIVGIDGLLPTLSAIIAGKTVLLANKESLVISGRLFIEKAKKYGARLLPIDSEHNAIFRTLSFSFQEKIGFMNLEEDGISSIILTGSGGPFRKSLLSTLDLMTPEQAYSHPNWSMGKKVSIDSATMMNKGLEYIEARWLFNVSEEQIEILIHPQSIIHSMVRYLDGSVLAQLSEPDMHIPIAYSMEWPKKSLFNVRRKKLDFVQLNSLTFSKPEYKRYPCLKLAIEAFHLGQAATIILNAANDIAVFAFLNRQIQFTKIAILIKLVLDKLELKEPKSIDEILYIDTKAREIAKKQVKRLAY